MELPLPRTVQDMLGTTYIDEGVITLDMSGVVRTPFERVTDGFLAFQVGNFEATGFLYGYYEDAKILSKNRRTELQICQEVLDGDRSAIENAPLGMTSDHRLQYLRADSRQPYADIFPTEVDSKFEETIDQALIAQEAGRMDEYFALVERVAESQVLPPDLALAFASQCLESKRTAQCIDVCRTLIDVPNYHYEEVALKALEYLAVSFVRENEPKGAMYATLEALHINISSTMAVNVLSRLVEVVSKDEEMALLLKLRAIAIARAEGHLEIATRLLDQLQRKYGGNSARFE